MSKDVLVGFLEDEYELLAGVRPVYSHDYRALGKGAVNSGVDSEADIGWTVRMSRSFSNAQYEMIEKDEAKSSELTPAGRIRFLKFVTQNPADDKAAKSKAITTIEAPLSERGKQGVQSMQAIIENALDAQQIASGYIAREIDKAPIGMDRFKSMTFVRDGREFRLAVNDRWTLPVSLYCNFTGGDVEKGTLRAFATQDDPRRMCAPLAYQIQKFKQLV